MSKTKREAAVGGAGKVIRKTFDGLPIVDAKADFSLVVRTADVQAAKGKQKDASNCILAKACAKQLGSSKVVFFRSVAYLDMPNSTGKRQVVRYMLDDDAAAVVHAFDRGQNVKGEVMVTLKAPTKSQTLDSALKRSQKTYEAKKSRKAVIRGQINGGSLGIFRKPRVTELDVRSGTGLVHNTLKKAKAVGA